MGNSNTTHDLPSDNNDDNSDTGLDAESLNIESGNKGEVEVRQTGIQKILNSPKTIIALIIYIIIFITLFIIFTPTYYCAAEWWEILIIATLFLVSNVTMCVRDIFTGKMEGLDEKACDLWTLVHFLAGCIFGVMFPFVWMQVLNIGWEILEFTTQGLGDLEIMANRVVDAIAVTSGWLVVVLSLYYQDRFIEFPLVWGNECHDWII